MHRLFWRSMHKDTGMTCGSPGMVNMVRKQPSLSKTWIPRLFSSATRMLPRTSVHIPRDRNGSNKDPSFPSYNRGLIMALGVAYYHLMHKRCKKMPFSLANLHFERWPYIPAYFGHSFVKYFSTIFSIIFNISIFFNKNFSTVGVWTHWELRSLHQSKHQFPSSQCLCFSKLPFGVIISSSDSYLEVQSEQLKTFVLALSFFIGKVRQLQWHYDRYAP